MKNSIMKSLPSLKTQKLIETPTISSSIQVSLNEKDTGEEGILGVFQDKMTNSNTLSL